jgi:hypothetical protein
VPHWFRKFVELIAVGDADAPRVGQATLSTQNWMLWRVRKRVFLMNRLRVGLPLGGVPVCRQDERRRREERGAR